MSRWLWLGSIRRVTFNQWQSAYIKTSILCSFWNTSWVLISECDLRNFAKELEVFALKDLLFLLNTLFCVLHTRIALEPLFYNKKKMSWWKRPQCPSFKWFRFLKNQSRWLNRRCDKVLILHSYMLFADSIFDI